VSGFQPCFNPCLLYSIPPFLPPLFSLPLRLPPHLQGFRVRGFRVLYFQYLNQKTSPIPKPKLQTLIIRSVNVGEVFHYAAMAARYPSSPLWCHKRKQMGTGARTAFRRIFSLLGGGAAEGGLSDAQISRYALLPLAVALRNMCCSPLL
jgi:hypothetical protein